jgi:hypothetical protein
LAASFTASYSDIPPEPITPGPPLPPWLIETAL